MEEIISYRHRSACAGSLLLCMVLAVTLQACATRTYYETPPAAPQLVQPLKAAVLTNGVPIRFVWQTSNTAEHYDFHLFDRTTGDIERYSMAALKSESVCAGGRCSVILTLDMASDSGHAWRVRASNSAGNSDWTRTVFQIE